jgi:hypothetical protein
MHIISTNQFETKVNRPKKFSLHGGGPQVVEGPGHRTMMPMPESGLGLGAKPLEKISTNLLCHMYILVHLGIRNTRRKWF